MTKLRKPHWLELLVYSAALTISVVALGIKHAEQQDLQHPQPIHYPHIH